MRRAKLWKHLSFSCIIDAAASMKAASKYFLYPIRRKVCSVLPRGQGSKRLEGWFWGSLHANQTKRNLFVVEEGIDWAQKPDIQLAGSFPCLGSVFKMFLEASVFLKCVPGYSSPWPGFWDPHFCSASASFFIMPWLLPSSYWCSSILLFCLGHINWNCMTLSPLQRTIGKQTLRVLLFGDRVKSTRDNRRRKVRD